MDIAATLPKVLNEIGDDTAIIDCKRITGGDINSAYYVKSAKRPYFVKVNENIPCQLLRC
jgi:fructosamine-3-kinase